MAVRREGGEQAERREQRVDGEGREDRANVRQRRDLDRRAQEDERQDDVEDELRAERGDVDRQRAPSAARASRQSRGRAPARPRTTTSRRRARAGRRACRPRTRSGSCAEKQRAADDDGQHPRRQEEPHRDEDRLRRDGEDAAELELHARRERVTQRRTRARAEIESGRCAGKSEGAERDDRKEHGGDAGSRRTRWSDALERLSSMSASSSIGAWEATGESRSHLRGIGTLVGALDGESR